MGVLSHLKPERVFYYFEELTKIPHGSYNCQAVSDYCVSVAEGLGLSVRQDEAFNVVIKKPASAGYGSEAVLMLQGHLDMVCVSDGSSEIDFMTKGLEAAVTEDGRFVYAKGTSLGGDDGIAVAMALAVLEDNTLAHPALEVVFTTEEEVGMEGVHALDVSDLTSRYMINLDSESEGTFTTGCAGGAKVTASFALEHAKVKGTVVSFAIEHLKGGHSGEEINKCRANANILLGRLLYTFHKELPFAIMGLNGGEKDNAIASEAYMALLVDEDDIPQLQTLIQAFAADIKTEFAVSDPDITVTCDPGEKGEFSVFSMSLTEKIIFALLHMPNGIQTMSAALPELVESSLNLGVLRTDADNVNMTWAVRSSVKSLKVLLIDKIEYMAELLGGEVSVHGEYPEWAYRQESPLREMMAAVYEEMFHQAPVVQTIHAGLECGVILEKLPELDIVSIGPDIYDIHTPKEHLDIASVERSYEYLTALLKRFKDYCR